MYRKIISKCLRNDRIGEIMERVDEAAFELWLQASDYGTRGGHPRPGVSMLQS